MKNNFNNMMAVYELSTMHREKSRNIKTKYIDTRQAMPSKYWCKFSLHPDQIIQTPEIIPRDHPPGE